MAVPRANSAATRARLLSAAERCFADMGYEGASLREITKRAGVNLAAVNYHFSSKRALWLEVMERRINPLNEERLRLLKEARAAVPPGQPVPLEKICEALLLPFGRIYTAGKGTNDVQARMVGRSMTESDELRKELNRRGLDTAARIFRAAFRETLPNVPEEELDWRFYFLVSAMLAALVRRGQQAGLSRTLDTNDVEKMMRRLVAFACSGLKAGMATTGGRK